MRCRTEGRKRGLGGMCGSISRRTLSPPLLSLLRLAMSPLFSTSEPTPSRSHSRITVEAGTQAKNSISLAELREGCIRVANLNRPSPIIVICARRVRP